MSGFDSQTGRYLSEIDHVRQSIRLIVTTQLGSLPLNRDFGVDLNKYIDSNVENIELISEISTAIARWEKRFSLRETRIKRGVGKISIQVRGMFKDKPMIVGVL